MANTRYAYHTVKELAEFSDKLISSAVRLKAELAKLRPEATGPLPIGGETARQRVFKWLGTWEDSLAASVAMINRFIDNGEPIPKDLAKKKNSKRKNKDKPKSKSEPKQ
jgi:hypothetical protein